MRKRDLEMRKRTSRNSENVGSCLLMFYICSQNCPKYDWTWVYTSYFIFLQCSTFEDYWDETQFITFLTCSVRIFFLIIFTLFISFAVRCFNCRGEGHKVRDCPSKKMRRKNRPENSRRTTKTRNETVNKTITIHNHYYRDHSFAKFS